MPNKNYISGRAFEYKVMKELRDMGFLVMRTAGSHGPFDIVAITDAGYVSLIQCKRVNDYNKVNALVNEFHKNLPLPRSEHYIQCLAVSVKGESGSLWF